MGLTNCVRFLKDVVGVFVDLENRGAADSLDSYLMGSSELIQVRVQEVNEDTTIGVAFLNSTIQIRLCALDNTESAESCYEMVACLKKLIEDRSIYLETYGLDSEGRTLATVYVMRESLLMNVNEQLVIQGCAKVSHTSYSHLPTHRRLRLIQLEKRASDKKVGLWKAQPSSSPWRWRKTNSA